MFGSHTLNNNNLYSSSSLIFDEGRKIAQHYYYWYPLNCEVKVLDAASKYESYIETAKTGLKMILFVLQFKFNSNYLRTQRNVVVFGLVTRRINKQQKKDT